MKFIENAEKQKILSGHKTPLMKDVDEAWNVTAGYVLAGKKGTHKGKAGRGLWGYSKDMDD
jgi:hypothetical protein